ncbi:MAG: D-alanyl-D-alanine carboxypeptidase, partial [Treponema sp.]|nr:D-alanyl-D-alanine carboxypeptidase [Treponema sp.]
LSWAFDNFKTVSVDAGQLENVRLWKGRENFVQLTINKEQIANNYGQIIDFTSPLDRANELYREIVITGNLVAPLPANYHAGYLVISDEIGELTRLPLVTTRAYERGNFFKRIWHSILLFFRS